MADTPRTSGSAPALAFRSTTFSVIERDGQPWLRAAEIAQALGYAREDAISRVYERNAAEFTPQMTETVKLTVSRNGGDLTNETRIFSLRGAHLIGMFARTELAAEFRRWVLDVLEQHTQALPQQATDTLLPSEQQTLSEIVHRKAATAGAALEGKALAEIWSRLHNKFRVARYSQLPRHQLADAICYVTGMELRSVPAAPPPQAAEQLNAHDMGRIANLVWMIGNWFGQHTAWTQAIWFALRRATGVPAPQRFTVQHLPTLAAELQRCWVMAEALRDAQREAQAVVLKRIIRRGEQAEPLLIELRAQLLEAAQTEREHFTGVLADWHERELAKLTAREPLLAWHSAWDVGREPGSAGG